ncbi:MAG: signal peptidase I [Clostridia bacterium]|nr:signal peptidase I [Clostridia bacterium]
MNRIRKTVGRCLLVLVITVSVMVLAISLLPRAFGFVPCGMHDDSMEPMFRKGALVLAKPIAFDAIEEGDVLVFSDPNSSANFTRVVREVWRSEQQLVTASASSDQVDPKTTAYRCVVGKVDRSIPFAGYPAVWMHTLPAKIILASLYIIWIAVEIESYSVSKRRETTA